MPDKYDQSKERAEKMRQYNKERNERLEKCGLCIKCGKEKAAVGRKQCPACLEKKRQANKERQEWLRKNGFCIHCGKEKAAIGFKLCPTCLEKGVKQHIQYERKHPNAGKERERKRKERLIAEGLCYVCGKNPPEEGKKLCSNCLLKARIRNIESRRKTKEKVSAKPAGTCYYSSCFERCLPGKRTCAKHYLMKLLILKKARKVQQKLYDEGIKEHPWDKSVKNYIRKKKLFKKWYQRRSETWKG